MSPWGHLCQIGTLPTLAACLLSSDCSRICATRRRWLCCGGVFATVLFHTPVGNSASVLTSGLDALCSVPDFAYAEARDHPWKHRYADKISFWLIDCLNR